MNNISEVIGERIKTCRSETKFTQDEIAEYCSVESRQTVGKWERGISTPSIQQLYILCELFQCDIGYLLGEQTSKIRVIDDVQKVIPLSDNSIKYLMSTNKLHIKCIDALLTEKSFPDILGRLFAISSKEMAYQNIKKQSKKDKLITRNKKVSSVFDFIANKTYQEILIDKYWLNETFMALLPSVSKKLQTCQEVTDFAQNYKEQQYMAFEKENPQILGGLACES